MRMGYGSAAVELLTRYFEGQIAPISETENKVDVEHSPIRVTEAAEKVSMLEEQVSLSQIFHLYWFHFVIDDLRGSTTFRIRFSKLLSDKFKKMDYKLAMSVLNPKINFPEVDFSGNSPDGFLNTLDGILSPYDMERLRAYTRNLTDFNLVYDFCKTLAHLYFEEKLPVSLSHVQASILLCLGLQESEFSSIERQMKLERVQIHSLFLKVAKNLYEYLNGVAGKEIESALPRLKERELELHSVSVDDNLNEGAKQVEEQMMKEKIKGLMDSELEQYVIGDEEGEALQHSKIPSSGVISIKSTKLENQNGFGKSIKKRSSDTHSSSSSKSKSSKKRRA